MNDSCSSHLKFLVCTVSSVHYVLPLFFQMLSKPLLVLSIATSLSDQTESMGGNSDDISDSPSYSEMYSELSSENSSTDARYCNEMAVGVLDFYILDQYSERTFVIFIVGYK